MPTLALIQLIIGVLPSLIKAAEILFTTKGSGPEKKAAVLGATDAVLQVVGSLGRNDAANPAKRAVMHDIAGSAVDAIVTGMNALQAWQSQEKSGQGGG